LNGVLSNSQSGGVIVCDRYSAYKKFAKDNPQYELAWCWAHVRRDFLDIFKGYSNLITWALDWVKDINQIYHLNNLRRALRNLEPCGQNLEKINDITDVNIKAETPHESVLTYVEADHQLREYMQKFWAKLDYQLDYMELPISAHQKLESLKTHQKGLGLFIDNVEIPMDNNAGERLLRGPVIGRKNYYGSGSEWSAELAATMFGLFATLKMWGINEQTWMMNYLNACAENNQKPPDDLSRFLPWQMTEEQKAYMKKSGKSLLEAINSS
jgi:transposase